MERDRENNHTLFFRDWTVLRFCFWGEDIKNYTDECVKAVEETIFDLLMNLDLDDGKND